MRALSGFLARVFLFLGAACVVAEVLLLTIGDADTLYSLQDLWASLHGPSLSELQEEVSGPLGGALWTPLNGFLALPSWLVFLALGGLLLLGGSGGRERTFG
ncbi:MAG: hypothetical protein ACLFU0_11095 [Alphaproteobacteria bacterium]